MEYYPLLVCSFLLIDITGSQRMTYKFEPCVLEKCKERCGKLTTYGQQVDGHCTVFNLCKCSPFRCEDARCATYCRQKRPELYFGGHCSIVKWCKCETQAFKRWLSKFLDS